MADIYANENMDYAVVELLRKMNHNVLTSNEARKANQKSIPDEQVVALLMLKNALCSLLTIRILKKYIESTHSIPASSSAQQRHFGACPSHPPGHSGSGGNTHQSTRTHHTAQPIRTTRLSLRPRFGANRTVKKLCS